MSSGRGESSSSPCRCSTASVPTRAGTTWFDASVCRNNMAPEEDQTRRPVSAISGPEWRLHESVQLPRSRPRTPLGGYRRRASSLRSAVELRLREICRRLLQDIVRSQELRVLTLELPQPRWLSVVSPGRRPASRSACRTQPRSVSAVRRSSWRSGDRAIELIAAHWDSCSLLARGNSTESRGNVLQVAGLPGFRLQTRS